MLSSKKVPILAVFTRFLIIGKIQDGGQDGDRVRPPPPIKCTSSRKEDQKLSSGGKIYSNYCNISKPLGRGSICPLLNHGGDMTLRVCPRVKFYLRRNKIAHVLIL